MVFSSLPAVASPSTRKTDEIVYLDYTGTRPIWTSSWADRPHGGDSDKAKLVVRLNLSAQTATVEGLFDRDDFVFEIKSKPDGITARASEVCRFSTVKWSAQIFP
jgi:hypothetical protein